MKKLILIFMFCSLGLNAQEIIEEISSGTSGDAVLKIEADTDNNNESDNSRIELMQDGGSLGAYIGFNIDWGGTTPDNLFRIGTRFSSVDNYNRLVIKGQDGSVGIGLSNPTSRLHVYEDISGSKTLLTLEKHESDIQDNSEINLDFIFSDGNSNGKPQARISTIANTDISKGAGMEAEGTADIKFWTANADTITSSVLSERMRITSLGNVGIGTTTPDSKLTVAGNIHAQEVKVTINAGADFVFKDDYNLKDLKDLEAFIKTNKHLPEIASEKEMQENGVLLAEMNIKLLQKIEELTLYTIKQDKQLKEQAIRLDKFEKKLNSTEK